MKHYLYDDTFEGLLTAVFYAYPCKEEVILARKSHYIPTLFSEPISIATEEDKFDRVYASILTKLSSSTLRHIYHLYLSELPAVDTLIYDYLKLCYTYSDKINLAKNNEVIIKVDTYCRKVTLEAHRFKGFVRFKEVSPDIFYSKIEPDYHILPLIMDHFNNRFSDQYFIIHDLKRQIAIVHTLDDIFLKDLTLADARKIEMGACEDQFEELFRSFYEDTILKNRKNPKQQSAYMPKRYWKNLVELS
ncbi:MAG: TIGR03915 family putative DNA repair protein [Cellulosilyticaceae bacterium]